MATLDAPFPEMLAKCIGEGEAIARLAWNDDRTVVAQRGYPDGVKINGNTSEALQLPEGTEIKFSPYLMEFDLATRLCQPWTPTQQDVFANDWFVVDR